ncbi:MAG: hypothetical protein J3R72DRAFT_422785 [Linnemannia gamsii]|nr:MAG: hypothetical protein J3R72DRAFT_422785 [Linnemannia gamsii]
MHAMKVLTKQNHPKVQPYIATGAKYRINNVLYKLPSSFPSCHSSTNNVQLAFIHSIVKNSRHPSQQEKKSSDNSSPTTPSPTRSESTYFKESRFVQLEVATKNLFRSIIGKMDHTMSNALAAIQFGSIGVLVSQAHQGSDMSDSVEPSVKDLHLLSSVTPQQPVAPFSVELNSNKDLTLLESGTLQSTCISTSLDSNPRAAEPRFLTGASSNRTNIFLHNVDVPTLQVPLPPPDSRVETTMQLAYCNQLLRTYSSASSAVASITIGLDPFQQASINALLQNKEEQSKIRKLGIQVVEEFLADSLKSSEKIAEVVLLGPFLNQEYYRKLLTCFVVELEATKLLDTGLLLGLVQLVECAENDYLQPDDLVRILVVLRARLQDTHQQATKHPYYLTLALSCILDVMVEGKVQDLSRIVDHAPLSALLSQLMESSDPNLRHQACYAHQGLLHVPNDETRRQFVLRHAGNIAMGLLGVTSVCNLDLNGLSDGAGKLCDATLLVELSLCMRAVKASPQAPRAASFLVEDFSGTPLYARLENTFRKVDCRISTA